MEKTLESHQVAKKNITLEEQEDQISRLNSWGKLYKKKLEVYKRPSRMSILGPICNWKKRGSKLRSGLIAERL